jgi:hypothetical protein
MPKRWAAIVIATIFCGAAALARAEDRPAARAAIERAIGVQGGADALNRAQVSLRVGTGVAWLGAEVPFRSEMVVNLPSQVRLTVEVNKTPLYKVLNGEQGWQTSGGAVTELSKEGLAEFQEEAYVYWLITLTPLLKDDFTLTSLPEVKVHGKPAVGVKVSAKGRPDVTLNFDKESGLLMRVARKTREAGLPVEKEYLLSDYKDFDGVKMPCKEVLNLNGRKITEVSYSNYKFLRKGEAGSFNRP